MEKALCCLRTRSKPFFCRIISEYAHKKRQNVQVAKAQSNAQKNSLPDSWLAKFSKKSILVPVIPVLEAHDVILSQVASRLDFYQEKRLLPHVFESMLGLDRM